MTLEEMKTILEQNSYSVKKLKKDVSWTSVGWIEVWDYIRISDPNVYRELRDYDKDAIRNHVKHRLRSCYGYTAYSKVPDDKIDEMMAFIVNEGISYYKQRFASKREV